MRCFDGDKNHRHEFKLILNSDSVLLSCKCLHVKRILHYVYHPLINKSWFFFFSFRQFLSKAVVMALNFLFSKILPQQSGKKIQLPRRHKN